MTNILVIGAGRSAIYLIEYLLNNALANNWQVTVADMDLHLAQSKTANYPHAKALAFDIRNEEQRRNLIRENDVIVSMLPAFMHGDVARDCVEFGKHMATASYVSADMKALDAEAQKKGLLLLNECGLDPGIDHASAMKVIDHIHAQGGNVMSFKSYCGGLVAPESNDNPWGYKFSWNPRNVVLAGQGTAQYLQHGDIKFIPYHRIFTQTDRVEIPGYGKFDAYANRDSLSYIDVYGLKHIQTMLRGTFRQQGYCKAWDVFVKLGLTDDLSRIVNAHRFTYKSLLASFLETSPGDLKSRLKSLLADQWDKELEEKLEYLELFSDKPVLLNEGTPAQLLQALLEEKWKLKPGDKDMIVMQHQFEFVLPGDKKLHKTTSSLGLIGKDEQYTAMALTVGLPLAITIKNFLSGRFKRSGVQIPIHKDIYEDLLRELETYGLNFVEA